VRAATSASQLSFRRRICTASLPITGLLAPQDGNHTRISAFQFLSFSAFYLFRPVPACYGFCYGSMIRNLGKMDFVTMLRLATDKS
jgi:hypothetical protein